MKQAASKAKLCQTVNKELEVLVLPCCKDYWGEYVLCSSHHNPAK